jgi:hypothetical protein
MVGARRASYVTLPNLFHLMFKATAVYGSVGGEDASGVDLPTHSPRALVGYESWLGVGFPTGSCKGSGSG